MLWGLTFPNTCQCSHQLRAWEAMQKCGFNCFTSKEHSNCKARRWWLRLCCSAERYTSSWGTQMLLVKDRLRKTRKVSRWTQEKALIGRTQEQQLKYKTIYLPGRLEKSSAIPALKVRVLSTETHKHYNNDFPATCRNWDLNLFVKVCSIYSFYHFQRKHLMLIELIR